jgi:hypothetical protein
MKKSSCFKSLLVAVIFIAGGKNANAIILTAVSGGGDWNTAATWDKNMVPASADDVIIPTTVSVTITADSAFCKTLVVQGTLTGSGINPLIINGDLTVSGMMTISYNTLAYNATINSGGTITVSATGKKLMLGTNGAESTFNNNGYVGSSTKGLYLEIYKSCPKLTLTGTPTGIPYFHSIRPDDISNTYLTGASQEIVIDQDIQILNTIGLVNSSSALKENIRTLTVNRGKTITLASSAYFHSSYISDGLFNSFTFKAREAWVYNIDGVLDASTYNAKINLQTNLNTSSYTDKNTLTINIGSTGIIKCGEWISKREGLPTNTIRVNISSGGTISYMGTSYTTNQNAVASTVFSVTNSLLTETNKNLIFSGSNDIKLSGDISVSGDYSQSGNVSGNKILLNGISIQSIDGGGKTIDTLIIANIGTDGVKTGSIKTMSVNSLTINAGAKLTTPNGATLNATCLKINSDAANGTGTYVDNGTSNISYAYIQQYLANGRNWYISSPVKSATSSSITTVTGNTLMSYKESNGTWPITDTFLDIMKGYIVNSPLSPCTVTFAGILNTGTESVTLFRTPDVSKSGFNLVGNPYPSYVDGQSAINNSVCLDKSIWYRTKNIADNYVFDVVNTFTGIGSNNNGFGDVTGIIPPMQAVWVRVATGNSTATLNFSNSMRSHGVSTNRLKMAEVPKTQQVLRLQVSNGINTDEAIVLFDAKALNEYDVYDSPKMSNNNPEIPEIYTITDTENLAINGMSSVSENNELALGFTTGTANNFTIRATQISNFDENTKIILKDLLLDKEQELSIGSEYNFSSLITNTISRFSILFKSAFITNEIENKAKDSQPMNIYINAADQIVIQYNDNSNREGLVTVTNLLGQKLFSTTVSGKSTLITRPFRKGVYFVTINIEKKNITKKVITI